MWSIFMIGLVAGIAATPHCLGMCGGFPLHLARSSRERSPALRQVLFVTGKTFTYVFLGVLAAALGAVVMKDTRLAPAAPALRLAAGLIMLVFGLGMLGVRLPGVPGLKRVSDAGLVRSLLGGLFSSPGPGAAFVLGLGVGFLPCPLPIGMLAIAAASHDIPAGVALMAGVGLGTAPGLLGVGILGVGLDRKFARVGMRAAGLVVCVIALLMIGRATGMIDADHPVNKALPCCRGEKP